MRRDYHRWHSTKLDRDMELLVFGDRGTPTILFPVLGGRFFEYEDAGLIHALAPVIDQGSLQVFCVDSIDMESWRNQDVHPHERVARHTAYEKYILDEVCPFAHGINGSERVSVAGCGFGGYHSLNLTMKHPDAVLSCISMSGSFDIHRFTNGFYDDDFYFNDPFAYLPSLTDRWFLDRYRSIDIVLAVGDHENLLNENRQMARILEEREIPHRLEIWKDERREWDLWPSMAKRLLAPKPATQMPT